jgi:proteasome lid subunit RPN8/RPN11
MAAVKYQGKSRIYIGTSEFSRIEMHAYSSLELEVGGFLVGKIEGGETLIGASIPALKAESKQISLTFTHEVWEDALNIVSREYRGQSIVGWYHTHPSFGIFLSEYDAFIQRNFFSNAGQVALVLDPISGEFGWFSGFTKAKEPRLVHKDRTTTGPVSRDGKNQSSRPSLTAFVSSVLGVALLAVLVTWGLTYDGDWPARAAKFESERNQTWSVLSSGILVYQVQDGDTFEVVGERFYPSSNPPDELWLANGWERGSIPELTPGATIYLVGVEGILPPNWQDVLSIDALIRELTAPVEQMPTPTPNESTTDE